MDIYCIDFWDNLYNSTDKLVEINLTWYVNTKLDNFFKVIKFELNGTYITECAMDSNMIIPVDIVG
jgi:hypothetical protein